MHILAGFSGAAWGSLLSCAASQLCATLPGPLSIPVSPQSASGLGNLLLFSSAAWLQVLGASLLADVSDTGRYIYSLCTGWGPSNSVHSTAVHLAWYSQAHSSCCPTGRSATCSAAVSWSSAPYPAHDLLGLQVEELSASAADKKQAKGQSDPLDQYCDDNPEADECRVYED